MSNIVRGVSPINSSMDVGRRYTVPGSETKDVFVLITVAVARVSALCQCSSPRFPQSDRNTQWVVLGKKL